MRYLLWCFSFYLLVCSAVSAQNAKIDSLKKVIETTKSDFIKNRTLYSLSFYLINQDDYLIALENTNKGLALALKIKDTLGVASHYMNMGLIKQYYQSDYQSANNYFLKAKETIEKKGAKIDLISIYSNIGTLRRMQGDFHQALYFLNKSLKLTEPNKAGVLLNNISLVYNDLGDYTRALDYLFKSLNIARKNNDKLNMSLTLGNIGLNYYNRKDYANALIYFKQSLVIAQERKNSYQIALMLNNIATSWIESKQNYEQALVYLKQSSDLFIEIGDNVGLAMTFINKRI